VKLEGREARQCRKEDSRGRAEAPGEEGRKKGYSLRRLLRERRDESVTVGRHPRSYRKGGRTAQTAHSIGLYCDKRGHDRKEPGGRRGIARGTRHAFDPWGLMGAMSAEEAVRRRGKGGIMRGRGGIDIQSIRSSEESIDFRAEGGGDGTIARDEIPWKRGKCREKGRSGGKKNTRGKRRELLGRERNLGEIKWESSLIGVKRHQGIWDSSVTKEGLLLRSWVSRFDSRSADAAKSGSRKL